MLRAFAVVAVAVVGAGLALFTLRPGEGSRTVVVPVRAQQDVLDSFDELRAAGLRVEIRQPMSISSLRIPEAIGVVPRPGTRVPRGSIVRVTPGEGPVGSPAVLQSMPALTPATTMKEFAPFLPD
jgi:beta-lactam-binding protein with PASTA domain